MHIYEYMYPCITVFTGMTWIDTVRANSGKTMSDANLEICNPVELNEALSTINQVSRHGGMCLSPTPACPARHNHEPSVYHHGTAPVDCEP